MHVIDKAVHSPLCLHNHTGHYGNMWDQYKLTFAAYTACSLDIAHVNVMIYQ